MTFKRFLYFCLFAIPFAPQGVGFYFGGGLPIIDIPRILTAILIVAWLLHKFVRGEGFNIRWNIVTKAMLLLIVAQFISVFCTDNYLLSFSQWFGYVFYYYIIFFILSDQLRNKKDVTVVIKIFVTLTLVLAAIACLEFVLQRGIYSQMRTAWSANPDALFSDDIWREVGVKASIGPFGTTHPFAFFFDLTFFLVLFSFYEEKGFYKKMFRMAGLFLVFAGLAATQVRSAFFALGFVLLLSFVRKKAMVEHVKRLLVIGIILCTLVFLVIRFLPPNFIENTFVTSLFRVSPEQSSYYKRVNGLQISLAQIAAKPILGYGAGAVIKHAYLETKFQVISDLPVPAVLWAESGILAFLAFIIMQIMALFNLYKCYFITLNRQRKELLFYLFLSLLCYSIALLGGPHMEASFTFFALLAVANFLTHPKQTTVTIL